MSRKSFVQKIGLILSDLLALMFSLMLATAILNYWRPGVDNVSFYTLGLSKASGVFVILVFWFQEHYSKRRPSFEELRLLYKTISIFAVLHLALAFFMAHHITKLLTVNFWIILLLVLPFFRYLTKAILIKFNYWQRNLYIIGTGTNALKTYNLLNRNKLLGYNLVAFVKIEEALEEVNNLPLPIISYTELTLKKPDRETEIVFALNSEELIENVNKVDFLQTRHSFVSFVPDISGIPLYGVELNHFFGSEQLFLRLENNLSRRFNRVMKRSSDIVLSLIALLTLLPVFFIIAILIKLTSQGNVFFKHERIGRLGKTFKCIKFQTMCINSDEVLDKLLKQDANARLEWETTHKLKNDPRITKIGKFLRSSSLDELPQLFNVLKGEMSLVGPRPIVAGEIKRYGYDFYYYKLVRPGITGVWQISGRSDIDYSSRVRLDVWYVKNWSLWYDFVIMLQTINAIIERKGAY